MNQYSSRKNFSYDPVRAAAVEALAQIEQGDQSDIAVSNVSNGKNFRPIDRRFLMQLVNGTIKMRRRIDHEMKFYLARPSQELPIILANIMRLGFFQLRFTDRIPDAAAVSESVNLALHMLNRPQANMVNAVLRSAIREPEKVQFVDKNDDPEKYLGDYHSYPEFFVKYCLREFGFENAEKLLAQYNKAPHVTYRVNFLKAKPEEVLALLDENEIEYTIGEHLPEFIHIVKGGLPLENELVDTGKVFIQDESAGLPVRLLNPRPGSSVIDLAAAPGGKATYCAVRMRNKGRVTALDKSHRRLKLLVDNTKKLGISIISPVVCDIGDFDGGQFDRVLLDPPCTGWGTAGKHSDLRWAKKEIDIRNLARIQKALLDKASFMVKPGGVLVYSTCTIIRDENDQVVEEFLIRHPEFQLESGVEFVNEKLVNSRGFVKTYPLQDKIDGAFCARLKKNVKA